MGGGKDIARTSSLGDDGTGRMQLISQRFNRGWVIRDNRHLDRRGVNRSGYENQSGTQEGGDAGKHGFIKVSRLMPTRLSDTLKHNQTPLRCTLGTIFRLRP